MVRGLAIRAKVVQAHLHGHDGWVRRLDAYLKHPQTGRALEHTWQGCSVNGPERSFFFDGRLQPSHRRIMAALSWPVRLWSMVMTNAQQAYTIGAGVLTWVGRRYKIKASLVNRYTNHNKPGKRKITIWRGYSSAIGASPLPYYITLRLLLREHWPLDKLPLWMQSDKGAATSDKAHWCPQELSIDCNLEYTVIRSSLTLNASRWKI